MIMYEVPSRERLMEVSITKLLRTLEAKFLLFLNKEYWVILS